jgi:hypothetical protein
MAKKKKLLKKLAKAALIGGALYGATKLGKRGKKVFPETENINIGVGGPQIPDIHENFITKKPKWKMPDDPGRHVWPNQAFAAKGGGIAKRGTGVALKHGGRVKSMGIAKRGGGVAKR